MGRTGDIRVERKRRLWHGAGLWKSRLTTRKSGLTWRGWVGVGAADGVAAGGGMRRGGQARPS